MNNPKLTELLDRLIHLRHELSDLEDDAERLGEEFERPHFEIHQANMLLIEAVSDLTELEAAK